jgi:hypothetical protein
MEELKHFVKTSKLKLLKWYLWEHENFNPLEISPLNKLGGGIYRLSNAANEIIYVGKSNDVHRRLLQHIGKDTNTAYFIEEVKKIEWHPEGSPIYQTLLEAIFIAYYKPKYNDEVKRSIKDELY